MSTSIDLSGPVAPAGIGGRDRGIRPRPFVLVVLVTARAVNILK